MISFLSSQEKKDNRENINKRRFIQEITQKSPSNVGVSFINKKAPRLVRLFEPEAFHTGNYTKITQQCECLFYKQKSPREEAIGS
jgi:hypothetical protein